MAHIALVNMFFRPGYLSKCDVKEAVGVGALAAYLRMHGHRVTILEPALRSWGINTTVDILIELEPDAIGLSIMAQFFGYSAPGTSRDQLPLSPLLDELRRHGYDKPIIVGVDGYASFDTEKLGWWKDGTLSLHAEYHYGNLSSNLGGVLLSSNVGMLLPLSNGLELTNISLIQSLGSRSSLIIGKINLLDLLANDPFFGGAGVSRFLNLAFSAPPSGLAPPVTIGGILSVQFNSSNRLDVHGV